MSSINVSGSRAHIAFLGSEHGNQALKNSNSRSFPSAKCPFCRGECCKDWEVLRLWKKRKMAKKNCICFTVLPRVMVVAILCYQKKIFCPCWKGGWCLVIVMDLEHSSYFFSFIIFTRGSTEKKKTQVK